MVEDAGCTLVCVEYRTNLERYITACCLKNKRKQKNNNSITIQICKYGGVKVGHINITKKKYAIYVHEQEKETHLDSGYKSVIALCRAVISSLDDGDDVQKTER